jgi:hypothetical protein
MEYRTALRADVRFWPSPAKVSLNKSVVQGNVLDALPEKAIAINDTDESHKSQERAFLILLSIIFISRNDTLELQFWWKIPEMILRSSK